MRIGFGWSEDFEGWDYITSFNVSIATSITLRNWFSSEPPANGRAHHSGKHVKSSLGRWPLMCLDLARSNIVAYLMRSMRSMLPLSCLSLSIRSIITARMVSRYLISTKINESLRQSIVSQLFARTCQSASSEHLHSSFIYLLQKVLTLKILWRSLVHKFTLFFLGFFCIVFKTIPVPTPWSLFNSLFQYHYNRYPRFFRVVALYLYRSHFRPQRIQLQVM